MAVYKVVAHARSATWLHPHPPLGRHTAGPVLAAAPGVAAARAGEAGGAQCGARLPGGAAAHRRWRGPVSGSTYTSLKCRDFQNLDNFKDFEFRRPGWPSGARHVFVRAGG